ncbi:MAG: ribosome biogenesis GTPase Der [Inquilinus sp.]|nr:ribosome biogenesis GTPase Der [Inquilinus sp.]
MPFTVAIVGRPNVGKSTLFNRLVGRSAALVDDRPGVTRDRRVGEARLGALTFTVVDTAGLEETPAEGTETQMIHQTQRAVAEADVAVLLFDARAGLTPMDRHFARELRRGKTPLILAANKCEGRAAEPGRLEAFELGLGEPLAISAEHGLGLTELADALRPFAEAAEAADGAEEEGAEGERIIQLAIVGRPNVGKSTLVNALVEDERVVTGPEPGVTRDAIAVNWEWRGQPIRLVDTAGLRRRARVADRLEKMSTADTFNAVRLAQVVVLVLDADAILDKQDLTIARHVVEEGRALVIAVNKWDQVEDRSEALQRLSDRLQTSLPQARGLPTVTISALRRQRLDKLLDAVLAIYEGWNRRVGTGQLNRWLEGVREAHPPPMAKGRRVKLRYATQVKARPPTFALFVSRPDALPDSYLRYLTNSLRETFDLPGIPLRLLLRKGKNPYA